MNHSPLQLERHYFTQVAIEAQPKGDVTVSSLVNAQVRLSKHAVEQNQYLMELQVSLIAPPEKMPTYLGKIILLGTFKVDPGYPKDKEQLVFINGAGILFGAVREMVANITARGPWPMVTLATVNFQNQKASPEQKPKKTAKI